MLFIISDGRGGQARGDCQPRARSNVPHIKLGRRLREDKFTLALTVRLAACALLRQSFFLYNAPSFLAHAHHWSAMVFISTSLIFASLAASTLAGRGDLRARHEKLNRAIHERSSGLALKANYTGSDFLDTRYAGSEGGASNHSLISPQQVAILYGQRPYERQGRLPLALQR